MTNSMENEQAELEQSFSNSLSQLVHEYSDEGLDADSMTDKLEWHIDVARVVCDDS